MIGNKIKKIIEAGIMAPSGENCQPWQLKVSGNNLDLYNNVERDTSIYNQNQSGSMVAMGAFIENVLVASRVIGLTPQMKISTEIENRSHIATFSFSESSSAEDPLYDAIPKRHTNRKLYSKIALNPDQVSALINSGLEVGGGKVKLLMDHEKILNLSSPISLNEQLIFENKHLHNFFYNHISWTKAEDAIKKDGFYIETLELNTAQKTAMKLLKSWWFAKLAKLLGVTKQIARDNAKNYASASALGIISIPSNKAIDYINAGRIMQRLWLKVTMMGYHLQPMTGVLFFKQALLSGTDKFSHEEVIQINDAYEAISKAFEVRDDNIAMLFRIGNGGTPSAYSSRFEIESFLVK
ncbi:MAG: hypothetical protein KW802_00980 [Candidatus Doudnabacteria bacterium]|nr:hypothetical protein [Candidatus Doudnabacteria bacterium]